MGSSERLDGWKAIAAHFNRERSTVMRWARDRDLPIRRIPGGPRGSVFAYRSELDHWAGRYGDALVDLPAAAPSMPPAPAPTPVPPRPIRHRWRTAAILLTGGTLLAAGIVGVGGFGIRAFESPAAKMPADPAVAARYVEARQSWGRRTYADLRAAIDSFNAVIAREPGFAPAYAALADAWLLEREYGETDDTTCFGAAQRAATAALRHDPDLPGAIRVIGFIAYWRDNDPAGARAAFDRALELDDSDAQTHFWYANILADTGDDARAQAEYARAQLLAPGLHALEVEHAYSHWLAGRDDRALQALRALAARYPDDPNLHLCLSWVLISRGDIAGYARETALMAEYRRKPELKRRALALLAAANTDPAAAARLLMAQQRERLAASPGSLRQTPAFFASSIGDRTALLTFMAEAERLNERWYSHSVTRRIAARWHDDPAVMAAMRRLPPDARSSDPTKNRAMPQLATFL